MSLLAPEPTRSAPERSPRIDARVGVDPRVLPPAPLVALPAPPVQTVLPLAAWASGLAGPVVESRRSRLLARVGGLVALVSLLSYIAWRILATLPPSGPWRWAAWLLVAFEAFPIFGSVAKLISTWSIDAQFVEPVAEAPYGMSVAVLIPTYNEEAEIVGPTVAAATRLQPAHQTWVLDDGDRPWLKELCRELGARYVTRVEHEHAKAGNLNHALALMAHEEADGGDPIDLVAVLDCDHVPLPAFLTSTLGYFEDEDIALVQAPQTFFNGGAFDDDGYTGEQGLFFNVQLAARAHAGAGTFWCGSTSVLRVAALREVGGVAQETVTEDMHTTLKLQRLGWRTAYHHQNLALGLAPATPEQYLVQRRRWGMGSMQVLVHEKLWHRQRWMSYRTQFEYLTGTLWWLEGLVTILALAVPATLLLTGAATSTVSPATFLAVFVTAFALRMWGYKQLLRRQIRWRTAFALRVLRVPVGLSCLWWLVSRKALQFKVTPKGAADERQRGRVPWIVVGMIVASVSLIGYAALGLVAWVPWRTDSSSTVSSGLWLVVAILVLSHAVMRIRAEQYATSRRAAHRFAVPIGVRVDGRPAHLVDVSVSGAAVRMDDGGRLPAGDLVVELPGAAPLRMQTTLTSASTTGVDDIVKLSTVDGDWATLRDLSLWLFHTPEGAVAALPAGIPVVAVQGR
ncbi:MAG: glycosyltransferase [Nocardioides sp.]